MANVDAGSFLIIVLAGTVAALTVTLAPRRFAPPVVVLELVLGIVIGPQVLGLAHSGTFVEFFANLGLGMLFFFAGYEIDFDRVRGAPLRLGLLGWAISVALAYAIGGALAAAGVVLSYLYAGSALTSTAIGTLIPILHDEGELETRFGTYLLAAGAVGELGPVMLLTLVLSSQSAIDRAAPLVAFVGLAIVLALISVRSAPTGWPVVERTIESSSQFAVRIAALLVFGLAELATSLGLDVVLGGFVAGMITRLAVRGREVSVLESKLTAVGFGLLIPFFFIQSGVEFNLDALFTSTGALLKLPLFLALFLVVRGLPALLLYRGVLAARDQLALAFYCSTALPLVVAITDVATDDGHMLSTTAAALVGAALVSTVAFPVLARVLRSPSRVASSPAPQAKSTGTFATDPHVVAEQAGMVATAWSPPGAPPSWQLTTAQFEALRDDQELLQIAATVPADRLPPLLFEAAATFLVLTLDPRPLRDWFPRLGQPQAALDPRFRAEYRAFCLDHRERLEELCASHRYQMNEVGRCADVLPALGPPAADGRGMVLVDIGTGAGLALHLDRYRYLYHEPGGDVTAAGDEESQVVIETDVRGPVRLPIPSRPPHIVDRVGIDVEPLDLADPDVRAWLAACIPQEIGAITRFHGAAEVAAAHPTRAVRGDGSAVLPEVLESIPDGPAVCLLDSYVHVFFEPQQLRRFRDVVDRAGADRDLDWISIDPLVPMGSAAERSVLGIPVPPSLIERNRRQGVFGVIGRVSYRKGRRSAALLGLAHPGAAWLEWLEPQAVTSPGRHSPPTPAP